MGIHVGDVLQSSSAGERMLGERLLRHGAEVLTDSELLVTLFGGAGPLSRATERMDNLLRAHGGLKALLQEEGTILAELPGLGSRRAAQLRAARELERRFQTGKDPRPILRTPKDIHAYLSPVFLGLTHEVFHVLSFNSRNVLLQDSRVAVGSTSACPVDPREVFRAALRGKAAGVVLAHNHPSGDPEPSQADLALTEQLMRGGLLLGLPVLDHVVVGERRYVSLLERNLLPKLGTGMGTPWKWAGGG